MTSDVMPSIVKMEAEVLKSLLIEVKETVATNIQMTQIAKPAFTTVNMWKIRRNGKTAMTLLRRNN